MSVARRSGIELLEESVDLLRRAPASAWIWYLSGAVSFFGAALIFFSRMTGATEVPDPAPWALALALLFGWRQYSRAWFAGELYGLLSGDDRPPHRLSAFSVIWFAGILRIPLLVVPFPAVTALFRNVSVLAVRADSPASVFRRAGGLGSRGSDQVVPLLTVAAASVVLWVNVFTGMLSLPVLAQMFTGQQLVFLRNPRALLNETVFVASIMVTWSIVDTLLTGFYALRVFYGESEETGADLLGSWRRALARAAVAASLVICLTGLARAAEPDRPQDLRQKIDQVLQEQPYQWRQPPALAKEQNAFVRWTDNLMAHIRGAIQSVRRGLSRVIDWLRDLFGSGAAPRPGGTPPTIGLRAVSWVVIVALAGALIVLLLRSGALRSRRLDAPALPAGPSPVDLEDPSVLASQLPENEWIAMAQDFRGRGEYRMALRAYFLASLAFLASKELLAVGRAKTNLDYLREVRRRARAVSGLDGLFAEGVLSFEGAWYGLHEVSEAEVAGFAHKFERMRGLVAGR
jgi:hypothetical protein